MKLKPILELTRAEHGVMLSFAVFLTYIILDVPLSSINPLVLGASLLVPFLIEVGAFSLNDYLDYKADLLNKRKDRPLVRGDIDKNTALLIFSISFIFAIILSLSLPKPALYIAIAFAFLSIAYDFYLKHLPLIGNITIALSMGIPFIFANAVVSTELNDLSLILFSMAFFLGVGREIIKDIEDMEGDEKASSSKTLPLVIGIRNSSIVASLFIVVFMLIAIIPFLFYFTPDFLSIILLMIAYFFVGHSLGLALFSMNESNYKAVAYSIRKKLLYGMAIGLVSLAIASLYSKGLFFNII